MANRVAIIGSSAGAAQAALTLAEMGIEVTIIAASSALDLGNNGDSITYSERPPFVWPLLLRAASHPLVTVYTSSDVSSIAGKRDKFVVRAAKKPRYVRKDVCTSCGRCEEACSVKTISLIDGQKITHSAIHAPIPGGKTVPSAYYIEKNGIAPCRAACPLGINVQGFVSLLSKGKIDEALSLINEAAPLAGILGRVCTHPCEDNCKRSEVDSPVFIQALHRFAADNAPAGINYSRKAAAGSKREKIAIVGSGPAGLSAAWELARRGYRPTIFESHGIVGGMLATGIPRFRLPWEVRYREVEAIKDMGVDIWTGVTVGRDVSFSDLRERGYRAFFLAIGAHENKKLNIPGEELEGVVDSMSLLFALNLKFGASVGSNVVVIGGGNSAIDSARTVKRRSKGIVRILYRRTAEEMTAVREEMEETIKEGISIEYLVSPIEILGDGTNVTGIRCQRMVMSEIGADGRRKPEPIPGSEFVIDADHVVIAIGQRPNSALLNLTRLEIDGDNATIKVDPLTLETTKPGIFAGGDCVTGPNNVVDAVASGLRAAVSIDRYLRGRNLTKGRSLETPVPVEVDVRERVTSYHKRAHMPSIPYSRRKRGYEETTLGLSQEVAEREAGRCLNCALCSECMECERVCELNAIFHNEDTEYIDIGAEIIIDFAHTNNGMDRYLPEHYMVQSSPLDIKGPGIYKVELDTDSSLESELAVAAAVALEAATELRLKEETPATGTDITYGSEILLEQKRGYEEPAATEKARIGIALCHCGGSISSVIDFNQVTNELLQLPGVCTVQEISQACSVEDANKIAAQAADWKLDRVVLAACRCCNLDQICFSCTEKRVMCQLNLSRSLVASHDTALEFVNIREQCAKVHRDEPASATRKAIDLISSGVASAREYLPVIYEEHPVERSALVLGIGLYGLVAARDLTKLGYSVTVISGAESGKPGEQQYPEYDEIRSGLLKQLDELGIPVKPWPHSIELEGSPGSYEAVLRYNSQVNRFRAGAVMVDIGELNRGTHPVINSISGDNLLNRLLARERNANILAGADSAALRGLTIKETAGIFIVSPDSDEPPDEQIVKGTAVASRVSAYLCRGKTSLRATAVTIDKKLCRGCGDCAAMCSYIVMRECNGEIPFAYVDKALCLGCGACIAHCPTGAISQTIQSNEQIISTLEAVLGKATSAVEAK